VSAPAGVPARRERPDAATRERLERFTTLLLERNAGTNLTAARTREAVAEHVLDSLALEPYLSEPFVDVGSGGGFPAIPLAIATGFRGVLVEATLKKARFLEETVRELGLPLEVRAQRAEDAGRDPALRERFACATARAVASLPAVLELTLPFLAIGGLAVLQRGRIEERERSAASDASLVLGGTLEREQRVGESELDERRILLVRKVSPTGPRFPRRAGVPARRPLCFDGTGGA
jgi:16S rRNA (guanine527-N7)-methyltransferase